MRHEDNTVLPPINLSRHEVLTRQSDRNIMEQWHQLESVSRFTRGDEREKKHKLAYIT